MASSEPVDKLALTQHLLGALKDAPVSAQERAELDQIQRDVDGAVLHRDAEAVQEHLQRAVELDDREAIQSIAYETMWLLQRKSQVGQS